MHRGRMSSSNATTTTTTSGRSRMVVRFLTVATVASAMWYASQHIITGGGIGIMSKFMSGSNTDHGGRTATTHRNIVRFGSSFSERVLAARATAHDTRDVGQNDLVSAAASSSSPTEASPSMSTSTRLLITLSTASSTTDRESTHSNGANPTFALPSRLLADVGGGVQEREHPSLKVSSFLRRFHTDTRFPCIGGCSLRLCISVL